MSKYLIPVMMIVALTGCRVEMSASQSSKDFKKKNDAQFVVERCVSGYKFAQDRWGNAQPTQIIDENGKGIPCE